MIKVGIAITILELDGISKTVYKGVHECKTYAVAKALAEEKYYEWAVSAGCTKTRLRSDWQDGVVLDRPEIKKIYKSESAKIGRKHFRNILSLRWKKLRRHKADV